MTERLAVVVLAGGAGSRIGGAKPRRRLGRTTLIGHALDLAQAYGRQVAVAVRDESQVSGAVEARLLLDDPDIEGPLAGLASALGFARGLGADWVLTLPCDSPRLPPDLALRLQQALRLGEAAALARSGGRLHPTCALWRVGCLEALTAYLATGRRSLKGFAATVGMRVVDWPLAETDPFANANTPEELAALQPPPSALVARNP
ncbi:MAG: molybdenum cofactor guanylyltransferase [Phenylobacterium sp.]|uniref:molybdenum cofactor guanylyltransferase n=1 Tax=Phenylobacterium sp. TaxID=1871053 RepID=UPI0011FC3861|nr:molybdenum cofactor guanylyltransferase [Phenylobacterium sp.]TAJ70281.1 MAG: molybdenum cofactor guanylyltransferase [Phenylobacterium sp.]